MLKRLASFVLIPALAAALAAVAYADDFPPSETVLEGFERVESRSPDGQTLGNIYRREKDSQVYIELPKDFSSRKYFIALTVSSGDEYAGLQAGDYYVYWRQYDNRLALILPNLDIRSTGEPESKSSIKRLFTDRVLADVPIVTMVTRGGPLIDADDLFVNSASTFFGNEYRPTRPNLTKLVKAKAFSKNLELAFETVGRNGLLQTLHYSLSEVPDEAGYATRVSDERIGYFTTAYDDLGKYREDDVKKRYINRWRLEKRDPKLKISPPVKPIRFYVEHTTPVRYRRWVKQGVEYWNEAFEKIGFADAIEVYYQDASTGAYMDLDPEDVQYNFIRWLNNNQGTAIGPSRVHPVTGEILDADIILTDGWIRHFNVEYEKMMPEIATEGMGPETLAWLANHPNWDPRVRFAAESEKRNLSAIINSSANQPLAGHPITQANSTLIGENPFDGLVGRTSQINGMCLAARGKKMQIAMGKMAFDVLTIAELDNAADEEGEEKKEEEKTDDSATPAPAEEGKPEEAANDKPAEEAAKPAEGEEKKDEDESKEEAKDEPKKPAEEELDGMPESFIGPLLAEIVAHEVGHTLGLRHNFKASSVYDLAQINSEEVKGKKALSGSVMDYLPINMPVDVGTARGDYSMIGIGPYDLWAIEYGYTPDEANLPKILERVAEPELQYATDEDTYGPDPLARRYDYAKNPLEYANNQMRLIEKFRSRLVDKFVKDGDSWSRARKGYELTLGMQMQSIQMMGNWIGGAIIHRDKKGDPGERKPIEPVDAGTQRAALQFVIEHAFVDGAFGLTPELLERMTLDKWWDDSSSITADSTFPVHDRILQIQASTLTMLLNPTTLRRVLDNEQVTSLDKDALVLPELMDKIMTAAWTELDTKPEGEVSARKPRISSTRRNLQREHMERLIDLSITEEGAAAMKPIATLAVMQLRDLKRKIDNALESRDALDPYSLAHLSEATHRIEKALNGEYIYNMPKNFGNGGQAILIIGEDGVVSQPNLNQAFPADLPSR